LALIEIRYTRPPDRVTVFRQQLLHETAGCTVTLLEHAQIEKPMIVRGRSVLERGSPIVWFTFPGLWHDIGRFHLPDGRFTGFYANMLTPVRIVSPLVWETTDLFLDVWLDDDGTVLLDEHELDAAAAAGNVSPELATTARDEAARLLDAARAGAWPPSICAEWTLDHARRVICGREHGTRGGTAV
jgi:predicted RNA-binding protein associated with RNAse of E/G family